ncbi:MAG: hypothetical protein ABJM38_19650 [Nitratireductor sp.]
MIGPLLLKLGGAGRAGAAGAASSGLSVLQGLGSVFGAVATTGSGIAANNQAKAEARQHEFEAREEFITGKETSAALKAELARTIGNQAVAFAAGGVDLGSVSVQTARAQAIEDAENELDLSSNQSLSRSLARRRAARNARARGRGALFSSVIGAGGQIANLGLDYRERYG